MSTLFTVVIIAWISFTSTFTIIYGFNEDFTRHTTIIKKCNAAGQIMYGTTVISCQVKEPKEK